MARRQRQEELISLPNTHCVACSQLSYSSMALMGFTSAFKIPSLDHLLLRYIFSSIVFSVYNQLQIRVYIMVITIIIKCMIYYLVMILQISSSVIDQL